MRSSITSGLMATLLAVVPATAFAHPNVDPDQNQDQTDQSDPSDQSQQASENDQSEQTNDQSAQMTGQGTPEFDRFEFTKTSGPRLGITVIGLTPELRSFYGAPRDRGVIVAHVEPRSPASRAGLRVGDILIGVQDQAVSNAADVLGALSNISRGERIPLMVIRSNQAINLQATLPSSHPTTSQSDHC